MIGEERLLNLAWRLQGIASRINVGKYTTGNGGVGLSLVPEIDKAIEETLGPNGQRVYRIEIIAEVGDGVGIVESNHGKIVFSVSHPFGNWPHGIEVQPQTVNQILEGYTRYVMEMK